jgi:CHAT domain-containing protein
MDIPWEMLHTGEAFLSLNCSLGISPLSKSRNVLRESKQMQQLRVLFIVDSKDDLPQTRSETERIISLLSQNSRVDCFVLEGKKATYGEVTSVLLNENFDILHVATHAIFDDSSILA